MNHQAIYTATRLFLDVRMQSAEGSTLPEERFAEALSLLGETDADNWLRYGCETLRELSKQDIRATYAFADAVHNTFHLKGIEDGLLLWPQSYWDIEIEPFRAAYGKVYFNDFTGFVKPDHEINDVDIDRKRKEEKYPGAVYSLLQTIYRRLCPRRGNNNS